MGTGRNQEVLNEVLDVEQAIPTISFNSIHYCIVMARGILQRVCVAAAVCCIEVSASAFPPLNNAAFAPPQGVPALASLAGDPFPVITCLPDDPVRVICPGGFPGITAEQCLDLGCCFSPTFTYDWCFTAKSTPSMGWANYSGAVERFGADQAIPAFASPLGTGHVSPDGDIAAVTCVAFPPLTGVCENGATDGLGFPYGLVVDGERAVGDLATQWFPQQVNRTATTPVGALNVSTSVRMLSDAPAVLISITIGPFNGGADTPAVSALLPLIVRDMSGR